MNLVCHACHLPYDPGTRTLELGGIILRPEARELVYGGRYTKVLPAQVNMIACMIRSGGEATVKDLFAACSKSSTTNPSVVKVQICKLRKAMKDAGLPLEIITVDRGKGRRYRFEAMD